MSPWAPRSTSTNPLGSQPTSFQKSIFFYCFERVLWATRCKAASGWHPCKSSLICSDQENPYFLPQLIFASWISCVKSARSVSNLIPFVLILATKMRSWAEVRWKDCRIDFTRRFWKFLSGLSPIFLLVAIPINPVPSLRINVTKSPRKRRPVW